MECHSLQGTGLLHLLSLAIPITKFKSIVVAIFAVIKTHSSGPINIALRIFKNKFYGNLACLFTCGEIKLVELASEDILP